MKQTSDNGYILGGYTNPIDPNGGYDFLIYKISENGDTQWNKRIGGDYGDLLYSLEITNDGGYIAGGPSFSNISRDKTDDSRGESDYWIVKLDSTGNILWQKTIGGSGYDLLKTILQTSDSGFVAAGTSDSPISGEKTDSSRGGQDYWILKLDTTGNIQWQKTIGGSSDDDLADMKITSDGGYILTGSSKSNISGEKSENSEGFYDYWVVKLNSTGDIEWQNTIGGADEDISTSIIQTLDNGYLVGGSSESNISGKKNENSQGYFDYWAVKLDANGNIAWQNNIGAINGERLNSISENVDGSLILGGDSSSPISGDKSVDGVYWLINHAAVLDIQEFSTQNKLTIYPNPVQSLLNIESIENSIEIVRIYDINGRLINEFKNTENPVSIDLSSLERGIYFAEISNSREVMMKKIIKE